MEDLSLNVSYVNMNEVFAWEVERAIRRLVDAGPIDLSLSELYVPVIGYLRSSFRISFPDGLPTEDMHDFTAKVKDSVEAMTFTDLLRMRDNRKGDKIFDRIMQLKPPPYSEEAKWLRKTAYNDMRKIDTFEFYNVVKQYIIPAIAKLADSVMAKLGKYIKEVLKEDYGAFLVELRDLMPAVGNHAELMATIAQYPDRKDKVNHFFDNVIIPVPLAYASVFVAQDKGIRDLLRNRTRILTRNSCHYCFDFAELEQWLVTEALV